MKKNKTTIILAGACVAVVLLAVFLLSSPDKDKTDVIDKPNTENVETTPTDTSKPEDKVDNNGESTNVESDTKNTFYKARQNGEKIVPIFLDGKKVGETNLYTKTGTYYVQLKGLNDSKVFDFKEQEDGSLVWDSERWIYTLTEGTITSHDKQWEEITKDADPEDEALKLGATRTFEYETFINYKDEIYLSETVISFIRNSFASDKGIHIIKDNISKTNSSRIETILQTSGETTKDIPTNILNSISKELFEDRFVIDVQSVGGIRENYNNESIQNILFNAFGNPDNIIYQNQYDEKQLIVMFDEDVSSAILQEIMNSIALDEEYTNVRTLVELDDNGKIEKIYIDTYYRFDNRDIYYYITISK